MLSMRTVNFWWVLLHLIILSVEDFREHQLSMPVILELGGTGLVYGWYTGHQPQIGLGLSLLFMGAVTQEKIGYGDGYLMFALGMWLSCSELLQLFLLGIGFLSLYGICTQKKELPMVPFLTAAYLLGGWI